MAGQPTRTLWHTKAYPPHKDCADRADHHDPTPTIDPERRYRHQLQGEKRNRGNRGELHGLVDGEDAAAISARHQLREIGIDGDELHADAKPGNEAPKIQAESIVLERHDDARHRVP